MIEHPGTAGKADWLSFGRIQVPRDYLDHLVKDGHKNTAAFFDAQNQLFRGIDLKGKRVLEIGSGKGLIAALVALQGASEVVSMEPELVGATSGVVEAQRRRMDALGLRQVQVEVADFNTWQGHASSFDVILSRNSINHLYPPSITRVRTPPHTPAIWPLPGTSIRCWHRAACSSRPTRRVMPSSPWRAPSASAAPGGGARLA